MTKSVKCLCRHAGRKFVNKRCVACGGVRGRQKWQKGLFRGMETEPVVDAQMAEPARVHMYHDSRHWQVQIDEADRVMPVTVYDGEGKVVRVIPVAELLQRGIDEGKLYRDNFHLFTHKK